MKKIKLNPKKPLTRNVNKKFTLTASSQGEISRSVLYSIKLKRLIRYLMDYGEKSGLDYQKLCALVNAIELIINKNNEIKKQNQQKNMLIGGYNGQNK